MYPEVVRQATANASCQADSGSLVVLNTTVLNMLQSDLVPRLSPNDLGLRRAWVGFSNQSGVLVSASGRPLETGLVNSVYRQDTFITDDVGYDCGLVWSRLTRERFISTSNCTKTRSYICQCECSNTIHLMSTFHLMCWMILLCVQLHCTTELAGTDGKILAASELSACTSQQRL